MSIELVRQYEAYLQNGGDKPNLSGVDLSGVDLSGVDFKGANLSGANLSGANLTRANLSGAYLTRANLTRANLSGAILPGAYLTGANLSGAYLTGANLARVKMARVDLTDAYLTGANLSGADLPRANLTYAYLTSAYLTNANLSGAKLPSQADFINKLKCDEYGIIAYKLIGNTYYKKPDHWVIAPGSFLTETVNPDRCTECGSGVNVATREWCDGEDGDELWKVRINWRDLTDIVVPFGTDGKFRASRVQLLEKVK